MLFVRTDAMETALGYAVWVAYYLEASSDPNVTEPLPPMYHNT